MIDVEAAVVEFRREITTGPNFQTFLGSPPVIDGCGYCTFCGHHKGFHNLADAWSYDESRQAREAHRNDFGPNGYYSDEPKLT